MDGLSDKEICLQIALCLNLDCGISSPLDIGSPTISAIYR